MIYFSLIETTDNEETCKYSDRQFNHQTIYCLHISLRMFVKKYA